MIANSWNKDYSYNTLSMHDFFHIKEKNLKILNYEECTYRNNKILNKF
jgi:hypothetical protein